MATVGKVKGNKMLLYKDSVAFGCTTNASFTLTNDTVEVTCKDFDGKKQFELGAQDWNMSVGGIFQFDNVGIDDLLDLAIAQTQFTIRFGTEVIGDFYLQGECLITNVQIDSPLNAPVTYSATLQGTGPITKAITT